MGRDVMLPLECLAELKDQLISLKAGDAKIPVWAVEEDRARFIHETEEEIAELEAHVLKHGNTWPQDCEE